ncbi:class I SAM-dependent methyltransferase [Microlunatus elymi]|uniref:Class I SAM-dependent methyltransferase n=1 Tax=Microlunatus elymi TaxID=2596828 RepID=A0A516PZ97_9ACTN|nr:class I SAM-dependent methyltransferase [Microlunatus elymi]QDP96477.1 class I SAM-dependent methyltransferase [Microlunatus elymi]
MQPTTSKPTTHSRYESHADWYLQYTKDWRSTAAAYLPPELAGRRVLDLACGWGQLSRIMADQGAEVTGVELSESFVRQAIRLDQERPTKINYLRGDATDTTWWEGEPFDGVVCNMALMDIDDLDAALCTAATVIKPGGWFLITLLHPCFPGDPGDPTNLSSWPPDRGYAAEGWWSTNESGVRGHVGANHRMLSSYLNSILAAGFILDHFDEPPTDLPQILAIECHRP